MSFLGTLSALAPFIGQGATAGLQIGAGRKNRRQARHLQEQQNLANMQMAEYAYKKDTEQWHRANEYNLPKNQMARLREAGINPATVFGHGTIAGNTQTGASPRYQAPRIEKSAIPRDFGSLNNLGQYFDLSLRQAQVDNIRADTDQKEQNANKTRIESAIQDTERKVIDSTEYINYNKQKRKWEIELQKQKFLDTAREASRKAEELKLKMSKFDQDQERQKLTNDLLRLDIKEKKLPVPREQMAYVLATLMLFKGMDWELPPVVQQFLKNAGIDIWDTLKKYQK